ncbi:MAG TPA: glycosyltransferase [Desulfomonilaceae bacterium]|nr:glycosyltransferase [Desulfomonilaceae bacterium]
MIVNSPLVSVIIPTYNRAQVVPAAVRSVLAQTYPHYELIVVDDGSRDGTAELLAEYGNAVTVITQEHKGVSAARNRGIRRSRGELIAFLDSDDEWLPDKLSNQTALFSKDNPVFICHTDEIWMRHGRELRQKAIHRKQGGAFFERALERCLISPSSVILSRALLDLVGVFDEDLPAAEDYDFWLRITAFHHVSFVPKPLVVKHGGGADQLSVITPAIDRFRIRAIMKILSYPDLPDRYRRAALLELIRKCRIVAAGCRKRGKIAEAEQYRELARSYEISLCQSGSGGSGR